MNSVADMNRTRDTDTLIRRVRSELQATLERWNAPEPPFDFRIGWSSSYKELFAGQYQETTSISELVERAQKYGRVLLHARGGGAKTEILRRLAVSGLEEGDYISLVLRLQELSEPDRSHWDQSLTFVERLTFLLDRHTTPEVTLLDINRLARTTGAVLLIDGLNELASRLASEILQVADELATINPHIGIVIADRLVRRDLPRSSDWRLATVRPLEESMVCRYLRDELGATRIFDEADGATRNLLRTPYFLNAVLHGERELSYTGHHAHYFDTHVSLTVDELEGAAASAFNVYKRYQARTFPIREFEGEAGGEVVRKLLEAEALSVDEDTAWFTHHLKHDYLAARFLAQNCDLWDNDSFTTLTFYASSFDALVMALEMIKEADEADRFVRSVYDWNLYGSAYVVAEGRRRSSIAVSTNMEAILVAMLADRRWDLFEETAERATDALLIFDTPLADQLLGATSQNEIREMVNDKELGDPEWRTHFLVSGCDAVEDKVVEELLRPDAVIGWTLANSLKGGQLNRNQQGKIRKMLKTPKDACRWRIVHTLGSYPSRRNQRALLEIMDDDEYVWARYGALRSLIEMAALGSDKLRASIFEELRERLVTLAAQAPHDTESRRLVEEFERAIFIAEDATPSDWGIRVHGVIQVLHDAESSIDRRDHWRDLAYRTRESYAPKV